MKKLITAVFAFLVLIPCVSHSMNDHEDEKGKMKTPPKSQSPRSGFKGYGGKFMGTDKRDVAVFQEDSQDNLSTRFMNVFGSWIWKAPTGENPKR